MPQSEFEPTAAKSERLRAIEALDRAPTVIGVMMAVIVMVV
jgi:hypothetical protein